MAYTIEEICWKVIDILGDDMPAKLDALEIEYASIPLTLEDINRYYIGDVVEAPNMQNMPAISVMGRRYSLIPAGIGNTNRETVKIEIEVYISGNMNMSLTIDSRTYMFSEIMDIKIMRYARAVREVLYAKRDLSSTCEYITITDIVVSDVMVSEGEFLKACRINLDVLCKRR